MRNPPSISNASALIAIAPVGATAIYARLLWIGIQVPGSAVRAGATERPVWPASLPHRPMVGLGTAERLLERVGHAFAAVLDVLWATPAAIRLNRVPLVSILVLVLASLAIAVSGVMTMACPTARTIFGRKNWSPE